MLARGVESSSTLAALKPQGALKQTPGGLHHDQRVWVLLVRWTDCPWAVSLASVAPAPCPPMRGSRASLLWLSLT